MAKKFDPLKAWFGLPADQGSVDYYTLLGLPRFEGNPELIFWAWRVRMAVVQQHMKGPYTRQAEEIAPLLKEARDCLLSPERKAEYDRKLRSMGDLTSGGPSKESTGSAFYRSTYGTPNLSLGTNVGKADPEKAASAAGRQVTHLPYAPSLQSRQQTASTPSNLDSIPLASVESSEEEPKSLKREYVRRERSSRDYSELFQAIALGVVAVVLLLLLGYAIYRMSATKGDERASREVAQSSGAEGATASKGEGGPRGGTAGFPATVLGKKESNEGAGSHSAVPTQQPPQSPSIQPPVRDSGRTGDQPPPARFDNPPPLFRPRDTSRPCSPPMPPSAQTAPQKPPGGEGFRTAEIRPADPDADAEVEKEEPGLPQPQEPTRSRQPGPPERPNVGENAGGRDLQPALLPEFGEFNPPKPQVTDRASAEALLRASGVATKSRLDSLANNVRYASEMVLLFETFLKLDGIAQEEKEKADTFVAMWKKRAEQQFVRLGDEWMAPAEWTRRKKEARSAFQHGVSAARRDAQLAIKELQRAGRLDPEFVTGHFVLGVLHGVYGPNPEPASTCFRACVSRKPNHLPAWNNLGLVEARKRSFASALSAFRKAVELGGSPEVTHNLKVILLADQKGIMPLPPATKQAFSQLYDRASNQFPEAKDPAGFVPKGFLYMLPTTKDLLEDGAAKAPLQGQLARRSPSPVSPDCRVVASAVGVVVAPTYFLTSRAGVLGGDAFQVVPPREDFSPTLAQLVATGEELGLDFALLQAPGYPGRPLPLCQPRFSIKVGSEVNTVSCLAGDSTRPRLTIEKCSVVATPDTSGGLLSKYYVLAGKPPSTLLGSVVVDHTGAVVAMYDVLAVFGFGGYTPAIAIECALPFLQSHVPGFQPALIEPEAGDQADVTEKAREAVVLVHVLSTPAMLDLLTGRQASGPGTPVGPALLDPWCLFCNGEGRVDCPNRRCNNGRISTTRERLLGHDPNTGRPIIVREPTTIPCDDCGGNGRVLCPVCKGTRFMK